MEKLINVNIIIILFHWIPLFHGYKVIILNGNGMH